MLFVPPSMPFMVPEAEAQSDTTPPAVNVYQSTMTNSTSNPAGKIIEFTAFVSDNVGVTSGPTCSPSSGSNFPIGSTTVTCTATDAAGNVGTGGYTVTVTLEGAPDTTVTFTTSTIPWDPNDTTVTNPYLGPLIDSLVVSGTIPSTLISSYVKHKGLDYKKEINFREIFKHQLQACFDILELE